MPESIKRETIGDRGATVIYLKKDFEPGTPDDHEMIKILYDDGDVAFATRKPPEDEEDEDDEPEDDEE